MKFYGQNFFPENLNIVSSYSLYNKQIQLNKASNLILKMNQLNGYNIDKSHKFEGNSETNIFFEGPVSP